jgi:hypothetical protein
MTQWISVKDQLPENNKEYLVYCKHGVYIDHFLPSLKSFVNDGVTHWMPLPEPTKDES